MGRPIEAGSRQPVGKIGRDWANTILHGIARRHMRQMAVRTGRRFGEKRKWQS
jgi:hypothetical protein